jgi:serine/threonine protein kinase
VTTQTPSSRLSNLPTPPTGRVIAGKYELVRPLAEGGMGSVHIARHVLTRVEVALKLMHGAASRDESAVERFLREVRFAAEIGHPGIVKVFDAGEDSDGTLFLAMELLSGEDMAERLARPATTAGQALDLLARVLPALSAAHARGIVHRDLKPENIFVARRPDGAEEVKLLDFGIARQVGVSSKTSVGTGLGTTHYMSPEQASNARDVRPASDVWALGVILYESITGVLPFDGASIHEVIIRAYTERHAPLTQFVPGLDARLVALVDRCLAKQASDRPEDAGALAAELEPLLADPAVRASLVGGRGGDRAAEGGGQFVVGTIDRASQLPSLPSTMPAPVLSERDIATQTNLPASTVSRRGLAVGVAVALILAVAGGATWFASRPSAGTPTGTATTAATSPTPVTPTPVTAAASPPTVDPANAAAAAGAAPAAGVAAGSDPAPTTEPGNPEDSGESSNSVANAPTPAAPQDTAPASPLAARPRLARPSSPRADDAPAEPAAPEPPAAAAPPPPPPVAAAPTPPPAPVARPVLPTLPRIPIPQLSPRPRPVQPPPRPAPVRPTGPDAPPVTF